MPPKPRRRYCVMLPWPCGVPGHLAKDHEKGGTWYPARASRKSTPQGHPAKVSRKGTPQGHPARARRSGRETHRPQWRASGDGVRERKAAVSREGAITGQETD